MSHITWTPKGNPRSVAFDDKYFCEDDGYSEALYIFCGGNDLKERFAQIPIDGPQAFTIAETGFGTGLNFLCAWKLFKESAPTNARLHYVSLDKFPFSPADLQRALSVWPEITAESNELVQAYSKLGEKGGELSLYGGRIKLTLFFMDVIEALDKMISADLKADAWFFDGFDPAKNTAMWAPEVFKRAAALSKTGTTCATFTVAGHVRRGLTAAGFTVAKAPGFGRKRQMLKGVLAGS